MSNAYIFIFYGYVGGWYDFLRFILHGYIICGINYKMHLLVMGIEYLIW